MRIVIPDPRDRAAVRRLLAMLDRCRRLNDDFLHQYSGIGMGKGRRRLRWANTYAPLVAGTAITWQQTGSTGGGMNNDGLTNTSARQGAKSATLVDATKGLPALLEVVAQTKVQSAPTDGLTLDCYVGFSSSATAATDNPAGLSGTDASLSSPSSVVGQLVFAGSVNMSNALGTTGLQLERFVLAPQNAYMCPVLFNNTGQTTSATANTTLITVTPFYQQSS